MKAPRWAWLVLALGCGPTRGARPPPDTTLDRTTAMLRHDALGVAIRDAVIDGDLATARADADLLGRVMLRPRADPRMDAATTRIASAPNLAAAARGVGDLGAACAACHARTTAPLRAPRTERPARGMHRHAWAMNELWQGLVADEDDRWEAGSECLADAANAVRPNTGLEKLGVRARAATAIDERAAVYGELLATCGDCHSRTR